MAYLFDVIVHMFTLHIYFKSFIVPDQIDLSVSWIIEQIHE